MRHDIRILAISFVLLGVFLPARVDAQPITRSQVGIFGAYQGVQHDMGTSVGIVGLPCCGQIGDGSGSGYAFGGLYQLPLASTLGLQFRASYSHMGGTLTSREVIGNAASNGAVTNAEVEYSFSPSVGILSFEPMLAWAPLKFPLTFSLGTQLGTLIGKSAEQRETLIAPTTATFTNGSATRNEGSGDLDANSVYFAPFVGVGYDIPVSSNMVVTPEVSYHLDVGNSFVGFLWKGDALRLGASVKMLFGGRDPGDVLPETPQLAISAGVRATGLYADSSEQPMVQVRVEEFLGTQLRPLLNYIFFDDNSSRIPSRYRAMTSDDARAFRVENLHYLGSLETYHQMLNIIGRRMQEYPDATLTLVGCSSEAGAEKSNANVSRQRAEAVRNYLRDVWNVPESRITIESRGLPKEPSNVNEADGIAENRRVEIYASNWRVMEPVLTSDTIRTANPPGIRFRTNASAEAGVASWKLTAGQNGRTLKEFSGTGAVPAMLDWHLEEDQTRVPKYPTPIDYQLEVTDKTGRTYAAPATQIPTDQVTITRKRRERVADKEVARYSLILFDFGSAELDDENRRIIDFIKSRITLDANVQITGYTDRVGDVAFNKQLSEQRAQATATAIGRGTPTGAGETMLFDNSLPEGRFYCRTVNVTVETPIEQ